MVSFFRFSFCLFGGTVGLFGFLRQDLNISPGRPPTHRTSPYLCLPRTGKRHTHLTLPLITIFMLYVLCACMGLYVLCVCRETKDGIRSPETRIMGDCKPLNPGLL